MTSGELGGASSGLSVNSVGIVSVVSVVTIVSARRKFARLAPPDLTSTSVSVLLYVSSNGMVTITRPYQFLTAWYNIFKGSRLQRILTGSYFLS